ncbi:MAG: hypothetical protein K0S56_1240 [Microvirga sp.]|jgi:hypothetical protein|nr:hypothetical protein [Microvirga sp.]
MAKLDEKRWQEISALWAAGTTSSLLANTYSVARQVIDRRAKRDGWTRDLTDDVALATQEKVHGVRQGASSEQRAAAIEALSDDRVKLITAHRSAWADVYDLDVAAMRVMQGEPTRYTRDFIKYAKGYHDPKTGEDIAGKPILDAKGEIQWFDPILDTTARLALAAKLMALFERRAGSLQTAQEGQRRAHGFDYKMQQESEQDDQIARRRRNELIDSILDVMEKGRTGHIATNETPELLS